MSKGGLRRKFSFGCSCVCGCKKDECLPDEGVCPPGCDGCHCIRDGCPCTTECPARAKEVGTDGEGSTTPAS